MYGISRSSLRDGITVRSTACLTLTFDHRDLDGTIAGHFLSKLVETLQNWSL